MKLWFVKYFKYYTYSGRGVSKEGTFLNNNKELLSISKGYIKASNESHNIKNILATTFKIPDSEKISEPDTKYKVFQVIKNKDYNINNLIIRTQSEDTVIRRRLNKELRDNEHNTSDSDIHSDDSDSDNEINEENKNESKNEVPASFIKNIEHKTHPNYKDMVFYKNGIVKTTIGNYTKGYVATNGYRCINIKSKSYKIHRLICFIFNPIKGKNKLSQYKNLEVDHINPDKNNNDASNLRWVTPSENRKAGVALNLYKANKTVIQYKELENGTKGNEVNRFITMTEAVQVLHISKHTLRKYSKNNTSYKGFFYELQKSK